MIPRLITEKAISLSKQFPILVVTGPRQSGKSTFVKNLFPHKPYVLLEDPDMQLLAETDPRGFLANYPDGAILDEIQRVPKLFSYLQGIVDAKNEEGLFILSGSQNFLLLESITQSLAGRVALLKLLPFSIAELTNTEFKNLSINQFIFNGLYPRLYDKKIDPSDYYPNYIQTYLERDVKTLKNISDLTVFTRFLKLCAARIGSVLNYTSIANDAGVSVNTIKSWISILEASYVIYLLPPYFKNLNKRLIKSPKIYFYDTGLACALLNIQSEKQVESHYLRGGLFENLVVSEILKYYYNQGKNAPCYFWQDQSGREIDLILENTEGVSAIEIKAGMTMSSDYFKNLKYLQGLLDSPIALNSFVIYTGLLSHQTKDGTLVSFTEMSNYITIPKS
jgi:uncharacterized protein